LDSATEKRTDLERLLDQSRREVEALLALQDASLTGLQKEAAKLRGNLHAKEAECCDLIKELQSRDRVLQTLEATMARVQQDIQHLHSTAAGQDEAIASGKQSIQEALIAGEGLSRWVLHFCSSKHYPVDVHPRACPDA
jgi:chromosome segregation ATPase